MFENYIKTLINKTKSYDTKAQNPFINKNQYNPFKSILEQTYIWVENQKENDILN